MEIFEECQKNPIKICKVLGKVWLSLTFTTRILIEPTTRLEDNESRYGPYSNPQSEDQKPRNKLTTS